MNPQHSYSENIFKQKLSPEQYRIMREKGTEAPFSGQYYMLNENGTYSCAACGNLLFDSKHKFFSSCGWPSFDDALPGSVKLIPDFSHGLTRTEVICSRCGSHLGHIFPDGPTDTGERFCINSLALNFEKNNNS